MYQELREYKDLIYAPGMWYCFGLFLDINCFESGHYSWSLKQHDLKRKKIEFFPMAINFKEMFFLALFLFLSFSKLGKAFVWSSLLAIITYYEISLSGLTYVSNFFFFFC